MELTADDLSEYYDELDEMDVKALLIAQTAELQRIRQLLEMQTHELVLGPDDAGGDADAESRYRCDRCETVVAADERRRHLEGDHGAPSDIAPETYFTAI